jgi:hypothetical protein
MIIAISIVLFCLCLLKISSRSNRISQVQEMEMAQDSDSKKGNVVRSQSIYIDRQDEHDIW